MRDELRLERSGISQRRARGVQQSLIVIVARNPKLVFNAGHFAGHGARGAAERFQIFYYGEIRVLTSRAAK